MSTSVRHVSNIKNREIPVDVFYTPLSVVLKHVNAVNAICDVFPDKRDFVWFDPFKGKGVYLDNFPTEKKEWAEIEEGVDFFTFEKPVDVICSNPPYSCITQVLEKCVNLKPRIISLLFNCLHMSPKRLELLKKNNYGLVHMFYFNIRKWFGSTIAFTFVFGADSKHCEIEHDNFNHYSNGGAISFLFQKKPMFDDESETDDVEDISEDEETGLNVAQLTITPFQPLLNFYETKVDYFLKKVDTGCNMYELSQKFTSGIIGAPLPSVFSINFQAEHTVLIQDCVAYANNLFDRKAVAEIHVSMSIFMFGILLSQIKRNIVSERQEVFFEEFYQKTKFQKRRNLSWLLQRWLEWPVI